MEKLIVAVIVVFAGWILFRRFRSIVKKGGCGCSDCAGCGSSGHCTSSKPEDGKKKF